MSSRARGEVNAGRHCPGAGTGPILLLSPANRRELHMTTRIRGALAFLLPLAAALPVQAQVPAGAEIARWEQRAQRVEIIRDRWGIAHVYGKTDADAVFGMEYAQAEDDFNRIEQNYLVQLGRLAEADGEQAIWQDDHGWLA